MASKYMTKYSTSLVEMQIKTMRYYYILTRLDKNEKSDNSKCLQGCGSSSRTCLHCC